MSTRVLVKNVPVQTLGMAGTGQQSMAGIISGWAFRLLDGAVAWQDRMVQRHALAGLESRMLRDVGLDGATALREGDRWD